VSEFEVVSFETIEIEMEMDWMKCELYRSATVNRIGNHFIRDWRKGTIAWDKELAVMRTETDGRKTQANLKLDIKLCRRATQLFQIILNWGREKHSR
jgi:hypothetical protein